MPSQTPLMSFFFPKNTYNYFEGENQNKSYDYFEDEKCMYCGTKMSNDKVRCQGCGA